MENNYNIRNVNLENSQMNENESYFIGEHIMALGNAWDAIFGVAEKAVMHIEKWVQKGEVLFKNLETDDNEYAGVLNEENEGISVLSLIKQNASKNIYVSSFPVLVGKRNVVKLKESYTWETKAEGEIAVETDSGKILNFFDPFFIMDKKMFEKDKTQPILLSGLALTISKMERQEFAVEKGNVYEHYLEEFLKENPDKTEKDFEPPVHVIDPEYFRMVMPTDTCSEVEIAAKIEDIEYVNFMGEKITIMKVNFEHGEDDEYLYCNIYASEHVLNGYKPQINDGITGIVWLTGHFYE